MTADEVIQRARDARRRIVEAGRLAELMRAARATAAAETAARRAEVRARRDRLDGMPPAHETVRAAVLEALEAHDATWADIVAHTRDKASQPPRRAVYEALRARGWSYPQIAALCGRACHTSVLYAINPKVRERKKYVRAVR